MTMHTGATSWCSSRWAQHQHLHQNAFLHHFLSRRSSSVLTHGNMCSDLTWQVLPTFGPTFNGVPFLVTFGWYSAYLFIGIQHIYCRMLGSVKTIYPWIRHYSLSLHKLSKSGPIEEKSFCIRGVCKNILLWICEWSLSNIPFLAQVKPWLRLEALVVIPGRDYTTDNKSNHPESIYYLEKILPGIDNTWNRYYLEKIIQRRTNLTIQILLFSEGPTPEWPFSI